MTKSYLDISEKKNGLKNNSLEFNKKFDVNTFSPPIESN